MAGFHFHAIKNKPAVHENRQSNGFYFGWQDRERIDSPVVICA